MTIYHRFTLSISSAFYKNGRGEALFVEAFRDRNPNSVGTMMSRLTFSSGARFRVKLRR